MSDGGQQHRTSRREPDEVDTDAAAAEGEQADVDDIDDLLDEIDAVLEENPEDFVRNYVQKGGQ